MKIIKDVFLFFASILVMLLVPFIALLLAITIPVLILLYLIALLLFKYPVATNLIIITSLAFSGFTILSILDLYFKCLVGITLICTIVTIILWISSMCEFAGVGKEPESPSKEKVTVDVESNTIIEPTVSNNSIVVEDFNNIFCDDTEIEYFSHTENVLTYSSLPFSQCQETINFEAFKGHNSNHLYDSDHYEDDDLCSGEKRNSTYATAKNIEPSRLVSLGISPDFICLNPNQKQTFTVYGIDQFGSKMFPGEITWKATGGKINSQGQLIINDDVKGIFRVIVTTIHPDDKISKRNLSRNLLLIKISLKIFLWILHHKRLAKDIALYFIQEFSNSELLVNEIFPDVDVNNINGVLTLLVFDEIKEWIIATAIDVIIDYLEKFIVLCFREESSLLNSSMNYVVLPELRNLTISPSSINIKPGESSNFKLIGIDQKEEKIAIERKINWEATGGSINSRGKLTVHRNSQGSFKVTATVANLSTSINYSVLLESSDLSTSSSNSNISSSSRKAKIHERRKIKYVPNSRRVNIENRENNFVYTDREKRDKLERKLCSSSSDWFCRTQLFYDGYSTDNTLCYEEYLEYMDLTDYNSYYKY